LSFLGFCISGLSFHVVYLIAFHLGEVWLHFHWLSGNSFGVTLWTSCDPAEWT
jgi:hypothetical protein